MFHLFYFVAIIFTLATVPMLGIIMIVAWPFAGMERARQHRCDAAIRRDKEQTELLRKIANQRDK